MFSKTSAPKPASAVDDHPMDLNNPNDIILGTENTTSQSKPSLVKRLKTDAVKSDKTMASRTGRRKEMETYEENKFFWKGYRVLCQFRFGYLSFLLTLVILLFSVTMLMEIFFAVFLPSARNAPDFYLRSILMLLALPFLLIIVSYFFEESVRFFVDCISKEYGSMSKFREALAIVIHYARHKNRMPCPREQTKAMSSSGVKKSDIEEQKNENYDTFSEAAPVSKVQSRWKTATSKTVAIKSVVSRFKDADYDGPEVDFSTFVIADLLVPFTFEVATISTFFISLFATLDISYAFLEYLRVGFVVVTVYFSLWVIVHFWTSRNPQMRMLKSSLSKRNREISITLLKLSIEKNSEFLYLTTIGYRFYIFIGVCFKTLVEFCCCGGKKLSKDTERSHQKLDEEEHDEQEQEHEQVESESRNGKVLRVPAEKTKVLISKVRSWNPWHRLSYSVKFMILIPMVALSAVLSFVNFYVGWILMGGTLVVLCFTISRRFPQIFGTTFRVYVSTFVFVSFIFFSSTFIIGTFVIGGDFKVTPPTNESISHNTQTHTWGQLPKYPICSFNYTSLDIIDFVLIADAAYGSTTEIQKRALGERFNGTELGDWQYVTRNNESIDHQVWFELYFPSINTTLVAVRGTASATDALEDLHFWFGILTMQFVDVFFPFLKQLPHDFVVYMISFSTLQSVAPPPVYIHLRNHVAELRKKHENLVLVGHSLGGAIAGMVGAYTKTPAMSFSGPGLLYTRGRFDIDEVDVRDFVVTVKPMKDIVPKVDKLGGLIQEIQCRKSSAMECHSTTTHACELYYSCGDKRNREWSHAEQCKDFIKM